MLLYYNAMQIVSIGYATTEIAYPNLYLIVYKETSNLIVSLAGYNTVNYKEKIHSP